MDYIACMAGICPNGRKGGKEGEGVGKGVIGWKQRLVPGYSEETKREGKTEELIYVWETAFLYF